MHYCDIDHIGRLRAAISKGQTDTTIGSPLASFSNNDLVKALKAMRKEPLTLENRTRLDELIAFYTKVASDDLTNGLTDLGVRLSSNADAHWRSENRPPAETIDG